MKLSSSGTRTEGTCKTRLSHLLSQPSPIDRLAPIGSDAVRNSMSCWPVLKSRQTRPVPIRPELPATAGIQRGVARTLWIPASAGNSHGGWALRLH